MATGVGPNLAITPNIGSVITPSTAITVATTGQPSGGTPAVLWTAGASGGRVNIIRIIQIQTTAAAGVISIWRWPAGAGNYFLINQVAYGIGTVSATVIQQPIDIPYQSLVLNLTDVIAVSNTVQSNTGATSASTHHVTAMGGNF